jgi:hypothetical protein
MAHSVTLTLTTLPPMCLVPVHSTYSQCLSSSYRLPFRWRRWRSRCCAAADGQVGFAAPDTPPLGRVTFANFVRARQRLSQHGVDRVPVAPSTRGLPMGTLINSMR